MQKSVGTVPAAYPTIPGLRTAHQTRISNEESPRRFVCGISSCTEKHRNHTYTKPVGIYRCPVSLFDCQSCEVWNHEDKTFK